MRKVRVGIIGAGGVAQSRHLPRLTSIDEVDLACIWSRDSIKATKVAKDFEIPKVANNWQEITESTSIDAIIIATPPNLHLPVTLSSLSSGKHVLCQARMARNLSEARKMLSASQKSDLVTALYPPLPGLKGDLMVKRLIHQENYLGEIREVRINGLARIPSNDKYSWQSDPDVTGLNTMTMGMWIEVLNRWVGKTESLIAKSTLHNKNRQDPEGQSLASNIPDSIAISAKLLCNAIGSYHFSNQAMLAPPQKIEIYGTTGTIDYTLFGDVLKIGKNNDEELSEIQIPDNEIRLQTTDSEFIRAITHGTNVEPSFQEGIEYMEFTEAVAISSFTEKNVTLPPEPMMDSWGKLID